MSPVRILYCTGDFKGAGTQRYLLNLVRTLDRSRFHPEVACLSKQGELRTAMEATGVPIDCFPLGGSLWHPRSLASVVALARRIRGSFDLVHTLLGHANVVGLLACALAGHRRVVASQRSTHPADFGSARSATVALGRALFRRVARRILVNNEAVATALREQGISDERIVLVPNGIDTDRLRPTADRSAARREAGLDADVPVVGYVGRLIPEKGLPRVLAASEILAVRHPELRVLVAGDGPARADVERSASVGVLRGRVRFLGFREDVERIYPLLDVFAFPTTYEEGTPHVVLEAMACGVPVVAQRVVQLEGVIRDGDNGILVNGTSPDELAAAIGALLDDSARASAVGHAGRRHVQDRHSLAATVRATEALYEREAVR